MIGPFGRVGSVGPSTGPARGLEALPGFGEALESLLRPQAAPAAPAAAPSGGLTFSKHAQARLTSRGITLDDTDLEDLGSAVDKLRQKGAKESLVLLGDNAFIVGVSDRKVITALTRQEAIGNIFTNIDSTVVAR